MNFFILFIGTTWTTADIFYIIQEQKIIVECDNFIDAIICLFSLYFSLDLEYPKSYSSILEFLQRYLFKINPVSGCKGNSAQQRKIFSLIEKILQHQQNNQQK